MCDDFFVVACFFQVYRNLRTGIFRSEKSANFGLKNLKISGRRFQAKTVNAFQGFIRTFGRSSTPSVGPTCNVYWADAQSALRFLEQHFCALCSRNWTVSFWRALKKLFLTVFKLIRECCSKRTDIVVVGVPVNWRLWLNVDVRVDGWSVCNHIFNFYGIKIYY